VRFGAPWSNLKKIGETGALGTETLALGEENEQLGADWTLGRET